MYVIAGLGNPGLRYARTRHNVGFCAVDVLADKYNIKVNAEKFKGLVGNGIIEGERVALVKPMTYMNLSGECVRAVMDFYKLEACSLIVIYDDIDLDPGRIRVRAKGSAGGHNGMKSIVQHMGTQEIARVRIGVGARPAQMDLADYVLSRFGPEEAEIVETAIGQAAQAAAVIVGEGVQAAMNRFNGKAE